MRRLVQTINRIKLKLFFSNHKPALLGKDYKTLAEALNAGEKLIIIPKI